MSYCAHATVELKIEVQPEAGDNYPIWEYVALANTACACSILACGFSQSHIQLINVYRFTRIRLAAGAQGVVTSTLKHCLGAAVDLVSDFKKNNLVKLNMTEFHTLLQL